MVDPRIKLLANKLTTYSVDVQKGENVLIELFDMPPEMGIELIKAVHERGGNPFIRTHSTKIIREQYMEYTQEAATMKCAHELKFMEQMNCYIAIRNAENSFEYSDVPSQQMSMLRKIMRPITDQRVNHTKWCVLRWPGASMAQAASMSTEAFEDFYFEVCTMDYKRMGDAMDSLVNLMQKTDKVRILSRETNLTFSIKDIPAIKCAGTMNIPDGEVFTAPVKDSVNGTVSFNTPTVYEGKRFENIKLMFENGKVIHAESSDTEALNKILDTDEGARYVGEFAIGVNPYITSAMCDILFDEKIAGSFHFTPGACYDEASNGNKSVIHWDMVLIQTPEYGGGEIYFDDVLVRKDGLFVVDELKALNPESLK